MPQAAASLDIALVQLDTALGDVDRNVETVIRHLDELRGRADLLVFPELTLTGYAVGARYHEAALRLDDPRFTRIVSATRGMAAAVGFIEEAPNIRFYNSLALIEDGALRAVHRKVSLPNYGIFEERKIFSPGASYRCTDLRGVRAAPLICADAWSPALAHLAALDDANLLVMSVCSPAAGLGSKLSSQECWKRLCRTYATLYGCYVAFVNRVGREGELSFWGQSELVDPFGRTVVAVPDDRQTVAIGRIELGTVREARTILPGVRDEDVDFLHTQFGRIRRERRRG